MTSGFWVIQDIQSHESFHMQVTSIDLHVFVCDLGVGKLQNKLAIHKTYRGPGAGIQDALCSIKINVPFLFSY